MKKLTNIALSKPVCLFFLFGAFVYGLILPWCWGNDPFSEFGTLSILCEDRKIFFWIWVIFIGGAYLLNTNYAYVKYKDNNKFIRVLSVLTFCACCAIALTLKHDVHSWGVKRIVHWIATGLYILTVALSVFIFLMRNRKKYTGFNVLAVITVILVAVVLVWLLTIGKSAMMEAIPNAIFQIVLLFLNFVPLFKEKKA